MSEAAAWLLERAGDAPPALLDAMRSALAEQPDGPVADTLAAGAVRLYGSLLRGSGGREDALPLLAADALLTHALEAQAAGDPAALEAFIRRWGGAGALGALAAGDAPE